MDCSTYATWFTLITYANLFSLFLKVAVQKLLRLQGFVGVYDVKQRFDSNPLLFGTVGFNHLLYIFIEWNAQVLIVGTLRAPISFALRFLTFLWRAHHLHYDQGLKNLLSTLPLPSIRNILVQSTFQNQRLSRAIHVGFQK